MKSAAESGEADELSERIDFLRVKESLKEQVKAQMAKEIAKGDDNPLGAMGAMMAMAMIDPMIDGIVTAEGMATMIQEGKLKREQSGEAPPESEPVDWRIERDGFDKFTAVIDGETGQKAGLVFERDGLSWKLVELDMPDNIPKAE